MHNKYVYGIDNDINQVSISLLVKLISLNTFSFDNTEWRREEN